MRVDGRLLREWPLPEPGGDKHSRGEVVVVGGAARSPGAAMLAGEAALRVGAGRLTLALAGSVAGAAATAFPETGVVPLDETRSGGVVGAGVRAAADDLGAADAVAVGPGLDDLDETAAMLARLPGLLGERTAVVLDAYALGALHRDPDAAEPLRGRLVLTPNRSEAGVLLGRELRDDDDVVELAERFGAAVTCFGTIAAADRIWSVDSGNTGLGTSGSGDVLAGAVAGLLARGADPAQAAVWGTWLHAAAGAALARRTGPLGFLASELLPELPHALALPG
jgi:ADP-dependent NAD(P)H-hydrate dehydratase